MTSPRACSSNDLSSITTPTSTVLTPAEYNLVQYPPYHHNVPLNTLLDCRTRKRSPPRAKNLWLIFRIAFASNLRAKFPERSYNLKEISKMASEDWKRQPFTVKRYFNALSKLALQRHKIIHPEYTYKPRGRRQKKKSQLLFIEVNEDKIMTRRNYNKNANKKQESRKDECGEFCSREVENECGYVEDISEQCQSEASQAIAEQYPVDQVISEQCWSMDDVISEAYQTVDQVISESCQPVDQATSGSYQPVDQVISGSYQTVDQVIFEPYQAINHSVAERYPVDQLEFPMNHVIAEQSPLSQITAEQYPANQAIVGHYPVNYDIAEQYQSDVNQIIVEQHPVYQFMADQYRSEMDQTVLKQYLLGHDQYPVDKLILERFPMDQVMAEKQSIVEQYLLDQVLAEYPVDGLVLRQYPVDHTLESQNELYDQVINRIR
ncbi:2564_t:CDS:1 [Paraglomus brasilianum]|uniref:2564_t:CDS:1 n=1 Tax=Paraglomus brasilianum TaxID=144538 RepID=A0A9N8WDS9_9GLOM|nr:2564_t:CDS:1 [Paraglomus brasilianum]